MQACLCQGGLSVSSFRLKKFQENRINTRRFERTKNERYKSTSFFSKRLTGVVPLVFEKVYFISVGRLVTVMQCQK